MYYFLTEQIQRKFIGELRTYWSYNPKHRDIVDKIQGKYSFKERPQYGIVLKNSSGNQAQLAADNFQGHVRSYVYLAHVEGYPNTSLEWVLEDYVAIQNNGGLFPSLPGIYYLDFCDQNGNPTDEVFFLDTLLDVYDETVLKINDTEYQLQHNSFLARSLTLRQMPGNLPLYEDVNYTSDPSTGAITLLHPLEENFYLMADYRSPGETTGPWKVHPDRALREPIPGVVLAFGRRIVPGDRLAVVVQATRDVSALEFGGRWDLTLDFEVIARDVYNQREILDQSGMYLWGVARSRLSSQGIEILSLNMGGESEEVYDDTADDYFYSGSFSLSLQTDWAIHVPLGITLRDVEPGGGVPIIPGTAPMVPPFVEQIAGLSDLEIARVQTKLAGLANLGLRAPWDPFFVGKRGRPGIYGTGGMLL